MFKFITHRPLWFNILVGFLLALAIFFIFVFSLNWITHHNQSMSVPSVQGKTYDEAVEILENAGFEVQIQDSIYVDTAKPHKVMKQVPEPEEQVKINRTVYLTINRAVPPMIEMPNIVGYSFRSAEMVLKNMNLNVYKIDAHYAAAIQHLINLASRNPHLLRNILTHLSRRNLSRLSLILRFEVEELALRHDPVG